jgi:hypothetical protein
MVTCACSSKWIFYELKYLEQSSFLTSVGTEVLLLKTVYMFAFPFIVSVLPFPLQTKALNLAFYYFRVIGFFNEADTLESNSILIYSLQEQSIYTLKTRHKAMLSKKKR